MATVRELFEQVQRNMDESKELVTSVGAVYKFVLEGEGGGTFIINLIDEPTVTEADGEAQCTIKMDAQDFVHLVETRGDSRQMFFMGKLRVEGDIGLAMKLRQVTELFK